ncbi:carboxypeptidase regulatory-like domain-containing protein [Telmatobacter sp. DSM 110680]|uniref:Carboxypeptidase regulatory-like domain-containing protein n=1 Tax=Telmatobacter sp. DSM 110680 TaxID=3036704 RepID=A0AAU7DJ63_9BACT
MAIFSLVPNWRALAQRFLLITCLFALASTATIAQSTYGSILGTVHDASGAAIQGAQVTLTNAGTAATRTEATDAGGNYAFRNIDVGLYKIAISAQGFQPQTMSGIELTARETRRADATMRIGGEVQTVVVDDTNSVPVITTDVSNLAETKIGDELVNLPVAIYSRSTGSTSPISTLTTEAGVQTDDSGNLAVLGTTAALLSVTVDGISSVGVEYSGPVNEMFPSFNSIEEIRVSESNNNAEFSGVADITTVSKAGTLHYHGGLFENHENTAFNANNPFTLAKPKIIMNDFGGTLGGPLHIKPLFSKQSPGFFFISYEGLRLPRETPIVLSVPSVDMRNGNLTDYLAGQGISAIYEPDGVTPIDPAHVPVSAISGSLLGALMPMPNFGPATAYANNYQINFPSPISSNQGDVRLDKNVSDKQSMFARFSYKNRQVITAPSAQCTFTYCAEAGSPLQGGYNTPEIDEGLTFAHNYVFKPNLLNEFRAGFNEQHTSETQSYSTTSLLTQTGITAVPQPDTEWSEAPQVLINGFMSTGAGNPGVQRGQIIEALDNVTWTKGKHALKFGADFKRLADHDDNVFGNYRSGWYVFDGSSSVGTAIGDPYTAFLLGYPDYTEVSTTNNPTMDGLGYSYAFYGQDDWHVTPNLTLNLGLRYELHPPLRETHQNTAAFMPDWTGVGTDGTTQVSGAVVVSNAKALADASPDLETAIAPTPILTAAQAGIPSVLRYTDHTDLGPRIGFAWRPYGKDTTVLRGGWGRFIESPLGFSLVSGWAVASSNVGTYNQGYQADGVTPVLSFPDPFDSSAVSSTGTAGFYYAFPIHYKDPTVQQWNLTLEQDLGHKIGMRLSYSGSHGSNLEAMVDLNQVQPNTIGYTAASANLPYPDWSIIQSVTNLAESNYSSGTVEFSRHGGNGLTFDSSYTWTKDLSDAGGAAPNAFAVAGGTYLTTRFHPGLDYGNVIYDRKHRFLTTWLYDLPFGRGKRWMSSGGVINGVLGDWELAGVTVLQSGPFLTPYQQSVDPANTNILTTVGQARPDQLSGVSVYAPQRTTTQWLNPAAFPYLNLQNPDGTGIGRFGNAPVGGVVGPGTANFSLSLMKSVALREKAKLQLSVEAANVFNHRNYEPPNMQVDSSGFGSITALQTAEGAGPRSLELTGRIVF